MSLGKINRRCIQQELTVAAVNYLIVGAVNYIRLQKFFRSFVETIFFWNFEKCQIKIYGDIYKIYLRIGNQK